MFSHHSKGFSFLDKFGKDLNFFNSISISSFFEFCFVCCFCRAEPSFLTMRPSRAELFCQKARAKTEPSRALARTQHYYLVGLGLVTYSLSVAIGHGKWHRKYFPWPVAVESTFCATFRSQWPRKVTKYLENLQHFS